MATKEVKNIGVELLAPDIKNPRIPESYVGSSDDDLILFIAENYDSATIAKSITEHEFFVSEPLIAVIEDDKYIVVEGNRRLAALKLLNNPDLLAKLSTKDEWADFMIGAEIPTEIPVVIADDRRSVAPIIGYRHISGIEPWDPYAKARYIAAQIEVENLSFEETASEVGEKESEVRASYRNYKIVEQASSLGIDANPVRENFGVFTRAMGSHIREFIDAPASKDVASNTPPIPRNKERELRELVDFLFGPHKVVNESRDLTTFAKVLGSEDGLAELRAGKSLADADVASGGLLQRLTSRLAGARNNLKAAQMDIASYRNEEDIIHLLDECRKALEALSE